MLFGVDPDAPLVVAANRDERLDRPALAMTVLTEGDPRILGGRDEQAGGTWLAVNDRGVVAGLTNRPAPDGADPARRTRGELPLALATHRSAAAAAEDLAARFHPDDYNPAWLVVGDRDELYYADFTAGDSPTVQALEPGVHVLENNPLGQRSAKAIHVRSLLGSVHPDRDGGRGLREGLERVLGDHTVPETDDPPRIPEALAACVHSERYGTRSSTLVRVGADHHARPEVWFADGHPCTAPFVDATPMWER
jgi:uncharacterized protein with NRDE domain